MGEKKEGYISNCFHFAEERGGGRKKRGKRNLRGEKKKKGSKSC